jgi:hypothetical protein
MVIISTFQASCRGRPNPERGLGPAVSGAGPMDTREYARVQARSDDSGLTAPNLNAAIRDALIAGWCPARVGERDVGELRGPFA